LPIRAERSPPSHTQAFSFSPHMVWLSHHFAIFRQHPFTHHFSAHTQPHTQFWQHHFASVRHSTLCTTLCTHTAFAHRCILVPTSNILHSMHQQLHPSRLSLWVPWHLNVTLIFAGRHHPSPHFTSHRHSSTSPASFLVTHRWQHSPHRVTTHRVGLAQVHLGCMQVPHNLGQQFLVHKGGGTAKVNIHHFPQFQHFGTPQGIHTQAISFSHTTISIPTTRWFIFLPRPGPANSPGTPGASFSFFQARATTPGAGFITQFLPLFSLLAIHHTHFFSFHTHSFGIWATTIGVWPRGATIQTTTTIHHTLGFFQKNFKTFQQANFSLFWGGPRGRKVQTPRGTNKKPARGAHRAFQFSFWQKAPILKAGQFKVFKATHTFRGSSPQGFQHTNSFGTKVFSPHTTRARFQVGHHRAEAHKFLVRPSIFYNFLKNSFLKNPPTFFGETHFFPGPFFKIFWGTNFGWLGQQGQFTHRGEFLSARHTKISWGRGQLFSTIGFFQTGTLFCTLSAIWCHPTNRGTILGG